MTFGSPIWYSKFFPIISANNESLNGEEEEKNLTKISTIHLTIQIHTKGFYQSRRFDELESEKFMLGVRTSSDGYVSKVLGLLRSGK